MDKKVVLGIDIAKLKFDVALLKNNKYKTKVFTNNNKGFDALIAWLVKHDSQTSHACLEATGIYGEALSEYLSDKNILVSVVNPAQVKGFGTSELSRIKTDKTDAKLIARFCKAMNPAQWKPSPKEIRELKGLVNRLETLTVMKQCEQNRLEISLDVVKPSIEKVINLLDLEISEVKVKIKKHIDSYPNLKKQQDLLETIPGIGPITIARILSTMCTPEKFTTARQLVAFVGLNPKHRQSGSSLQGRSHISKTGDTALRKSLYMPAIVAKQYNPILKEFYERLLSTGKSKMLAICAVMRKLLHIIYGVLKSGIPFDSSYEINRNKLAIT